ncbi:MAG TPA: hypothetical protein PLC59_08025 [Bacteroidales bacterium]|jgi:carbonic anhydrase/acetyltransferase-like protein (isoleucine patch superfamily)|nr:hypothetical protein [Bacteroidales bacterium]
MKLHLKKKGVWTQLSEKRLQRQLEIQNITICENSNIDPSVKINPGVWVDTTRRIHANVEIGPSSYIGKDVTISWNCRIGNQVHISTDTRIECNCQIGNNVSIGHNVTIYQNCVLGAKCEIGPAAVIAEGSVIGKNVIIPADAYVSTRAIIQNVSDCVVLNPVCLYPVPPVHTCTPFCLTLFRSDTGVIKASMRINDSWETLTVTEAHKQLYYQPGLLAAIDFAVAHMMFSPQGMGMDVAATF